MNSKQGTRYIKRRMGNDLKEKIFVYNGIISESEKQKKPTVLICPRCNLVNAIDNKYCSRCSYPLTPSAFEEIKAVRVLILLVYYNHLLFYIISIAKLKNTN